jgi:hypothetical protein
MSMNNDSDDTGEVTEKLDLSGASFLDEFKPPKVVRRHSIAYAPSPPTTGVETNEKSDTSNLDLSGAMDFLDLEAEPRESHVTTPSNTLPSETKVTSHDLVLSRLVRASPSYSSSQAQRRLYSLHQFASAPTVNADGTKSKIQTLGSINARPPRPFPASKRRKNRQSFFVPGRFAMGDDELIHPLRALDSCAGDYSSAEEDSIPKRRKESESVLVTDAAPLSETSQNDSFQDEAVHPSKDLAVDEFPVVQESAAQRRRKRQSIFLPSDSTDDDPSEVTEFFEGLAKYGVQDNEKATNESVVQDQCRSANPVPSDASSNELTTMRQLVRAYCSLDEEARGSSDVAKQIEELSSYPLASRALPEGDGSSQSLYERKHALLVELGPMVEQMDQGKTLEKDRCERETGFRVEKTRSGRYRYYSSETNQRVTPQEYEEAYIRQLEQSAEAKGLAIQKFLRDFDKTIYLHEKKDSIESATTTEVTSWNSDKDNDERLILDAGIVTSKGGEDDSMDISETQSPIEAEVLESERPENETHEIQIMKGPVTSQQVVLPLPPRDELPTDPDMAIAHQKLWEVIDDALETYSRTVFAIKAAKDYAESE